MQNVTFLSFLPFSSSNSSETASSASRLAVLATDLALLLFASSTAFCAKSAANSASTPISESLSANEPSLRLATSVSSLFPSGEKNIISSTLSANSGEKSFAASAETDLLAASEFELDDDYDDGDDDFEIRTLGDADEDGE